MANRFIVDVREPGSMYEVVSPRCHRLLTSCVQNKIPPCLHPILPPLPLTAFFVAIHCKIVQLNLHFPHDPWLYSPTWQLLTTRDYLNLYLNQLLLNKFYITKKSVSQFYLVPFKGSIASYSQTANAQNISPPHGSVFEKRQSIEYLRLPFVFLMRYKYRLGTMTCTGLNIIFLSYT